MGSTYVVGREPDKAAWLSRPRYECGPACLCDQASCVNRASQQGLNAEVTVEKTEKVRSLGQATVSAGEQFTSFANATALKVCKLRKHSVPVIMPA